MKSVTTEMSQKKQNKNKIRSCVPRSVTSTHIHHLPRKEPVFDKIIDILAELCQPTALAQGSKVEQGHHQGLGEAPKTLPRPPFTLHRLKVSEACSPCQSTAPHQAVTQNGPLKELTVEEEENYNQIFMHTQPE